MVPGKATGGKVLYTVTTRSTVPTGLMSQNGSSVLATREHLY